MKKWIYVVGVAAIVAAPEAMARAVRAPAPAPEAAPSLSPSPLLALPQPNFDVLGGPFQYKAGVTFMSENIWRGISITNHRPGAMAYGEIGKGWFYLGGDVLNVTLPTSPAAQLDIYGGVRPNWGPLTLDFGAVYHGRPGNQQQYFLGGLSPVLTYWTPGGMPTTPFDQSFVEIYAKPSWALNDYLTIGAEIGYDPSWANYNAHALYSGGNAKLSLPGTGASISGAFGHYFLGMGDPTYGPSYIQPGVKGIQGFKLSSYNTWNIGASYKWKAITLDVRYHDNTLTRRGCFTNVANPAGNFAAAVWGQGYSDWCDSRVVGSINVELDSTMFQ
ncbi:hypothetical protein [Methylocystis sp. JR02]|uniref:hypothetical protein n=1 Tax=Methylocystis sp. JR02 TaxID=3046284 RepID=UPI0024B9107A|nr:hypothetical protein [Methylocystis sp. JR02]MDJ0448277.1 hypothetical protein [Methylocystis sp. JR02]